MIKIENVAVHGWEVAIRGMRNPLNSWDKSDSNVCVSWYDEECSKDCIYYCFCDENTERLIAGENDLALMKQLVKAGTDHRKFMRFITVTCDITAPLYWWKEADTYKVGTVSNSCSTMHTVHKKEFTLDDFSHEQLISTCNDDSCDALVLDGTTVRVGGVDLLGLTINVLNYYRSRYLKTKDKKYWWQIIQLLPSSYNQRRTLMLNYEVLRNMYHARKNHKLDEWQAFCKWIEMLPYSELITEV